MKNEVTTSPRSLYLDIRADPDEVQQRLEALLNRMKIVAMGQQDISPRYDAIPLITRASHRLRDAKLSELTDSGGSYQIASFAPDYDNADSIDILKNTLPHVDGECKSYSHGGCELVLPEESSVSFDNSGHIVSADDERLVGADIFHYFACHIRQDLAVALLEGDSLSYAADISAFEKTPKDEQGKNTHIGRDLYEFHSNAPNFGPVLRELFPLLVRLFREDMLDVLTVDLNGQRQYQNDEEGSVRRFERDRFVPLHRDDGSFMGFMGMADVFMQNTEEQRSPYQGGSFVRGVELQSDVSTDIKNIAAMVSSESISYPERMQLLGKLLCKKDKHFDEVVEVATCLNKLEFGEKLKLYGISYISDECINSCTYCGHSAAIDQPRSSLTPGQMEEDFDAILKYRPDELCILAGEHRKLVEQCCQALQVVNIVNAKYESPLECVTFNIAPQSLEGFAEIASEADPELRLQYRIFQETYNPSQYRQYHSCGPKSNFHHRLTSQERALQAGFSDVGIGALMGLNTAGHDSEIVALIQHADRIKQMFGQHPKTLSIPRHQPVAGYCFDTPRPVDDDSYIYYHALLKIFLPKTELIITSRETSELIKTLEPLVNVRDLAPRPGVGGNINPDAHFQNELGDSRSAEEILKDLRERGKR